MFWLLVISPLPVIIIGLGIILAYRNDPYFRWTRIESPLVTKVQNGQIVLIEQFKPKLVTNIFSRGYSLFITGVRIPFYSLLTKERRLRGTEQEIIDKIHQRRFNPQKPYVITGSHYPDLYMRNMGTFFNAILDPRLSSTDLDWQNRQRISLQTVAYDLEFLAQNKQAVTTIIPLGQKKFTAVNIYKQPSDSLFSVLFSLRALTDDQFLPKLFPALHPVKSRSLQTVATTKQLLATYRDSLSISINHYLKMAIDPETGLICRNLHLSSARDGVKRDCSFYDNVIAWATVKLATELDIPHNSTADLNHWKKNILASYWDETLGIFRDDLYGWTPGSGEKESPVPIFSADSFIVTSSGFFNLRQKNDRQKLERMVAYVRSHKLDVPFPLSYTAINNRKQMHGPVRWFAPSYMGKGIWSHWGMEYIKALLLLAPKNQILAEEAAHHLAAYAYNIEKWGGYPELYSRQGKLYKSLLLRGVLHTGWVVNYEQAKMMMNDILQS